MHVEEQNDLRMETPLFSRLYVINSGDSDNLRLCFPGGDEREKTYHSRNLRIAGLIEEVATEKENGNAMRHKAEVVTDESSIPSSNSPYSAQIFPYQEETDECEDGPRDKDVHVLCTMHACQ